MTIEKAREIEAEARRARDRYPWAASLCWVMWFATLDTALMWAAGALTLASAAQLGVWFAARTLVRDMEDMEEEA